MFLYIARTSRRDVWSAADWPLMRACGLIIAFLGRLLLKHHVVALTLGPGAQFSRDPHSTHPAL